MTAYTLEVLTGRKHAPPTGSDRMASVTGSDRMASIWPISSPLEAGVVATECAIGKCRNDERQAEEEREERMMRKRKLKWEDKMMVEEKAKMVES